MSVNSILSPATHSLEMSFNHLLYRSDNTVMPSDEAPAGEQGKREYLLPEKLVTNTLEKANRSLANAERRLEFSVHEATKAVIVKVVNSGTNEVVREIPSEKILDMVATMCKTAGILVDEKR